MLHNPTDYPNPFKFDPDRFTGPKPCPDPTAVAFGFGKRICPGRQLAISCISLAVAAILGNFEIKKAKDDDDDDGDDDESNDGWKGVEPKTHETAYALVRTPLPFSCCFIPRSQGNKKNNING